MTTKPRFVAITSSLPSTTSDKFIAKVNNAPDIPQFNLQQLNMVQIAQDLSQMINKPNPRMWLSKWWQNKKLPLDNERIGHMATYVERIRAVNSSVTNLQYELYISPQILSDLVNGYYLEAQQKTELQIKQHEDALHALDQQMIGRELVNEKMRVEIQKGRAEARLTDSQADMLQMIITNIDFTKITPELLLLAIKTMNPLANVQIDFAMIEAQIEKMKAEASRIKAETAGKYVQVDQDKFVHEQTKKRYNKPGDSSKS